MLKKSWNFRIWYYKASHWWSNLWCWETKHDGHRQFDSSRTQVSRP